MPRFARLRVGETEQTGLAEFVAAVLRQGVPYVVLVAQSLGIAPHVRAHLVVEGIPLRHARIDQTVRRERLRVNEVVVGASERSVVKPFETLPVAHGVEQVDLHGEHAAAHFTGAEALDAFSQRWSRCSADDFEDLGRVLGIGDQLP